MAILSKATSSLLLLSSFSLLPSTSANPVPRDHNTAPYASVPVCDTILKGAATVPVASAWGANLDAMGDESDQCMTNPAIQPSVIGGTTDDKINPDRSNVWLIQGRVSRTGQWDEGMEILNMGCARAGNYVGGIIGACQFRNPEGVMVVSGCQDVTETPGLEICVGGFRDNFPA